MATSPCNGLRCHSARAQTWSTPLSAMRNTKVLGRASLDEQNFAPKSGSFPSLSGTAPCVSRHKPDRRIELTFRFGANLVVWQSAVFG